MDNIQKNSDSTVPLIKCKTTLVDIILDEGSNLQVPFPSNLIFKADNSTIPHIIHNIWLTNPSSPRELRDQDLQNIIHTNELYKSSTQKWNHILWVNDKSVLPNSIESLQKTNVEVREISEIQDQIKLYDIITHCIEKQAWGMASNILRYSLVNKFGGLYSDLNFECKKVLDNEFRQYDFINLMLTVSLFAAKPSHPIIVETLKIVEHNFESQPNYIQGLQEFIVDKGFDLIPDFDPMPYYYSSITSKMTSWPFRIAFFRMHGEDDNVDVIYPATSSHFPPERLEYENKYQYCHESQKVKELAYENCPNKIEGIIKALPFNDVNLMCGNDYYNIGSDSQDGGTWA